MNKINPKTIERIKEEIDIVEIIGKDIPLLKKGSNFVGLCPFHPDTNPSFTVSPTKKIFNCFVCNSGGDIITYKMKKEKISYYDSIKLLANNIGIRIEKEEIIPKLPMHEVYQDISKFYNTTLLITNEGREAKKYLKSRKMNDILIKKHEIGYSNPKLNSRGYLEKKIEDNKKYGNYELDSSNLYNDKYEFFANRIIIPIFDDLNRIVGFSGRTITGKDPKYLNSRESQLFEKNKILYNFNNAKNNFQKNELFIVEGFFDVFALEKVQIYNSVATMGTSFSMNHVDKIKKNRIKRIYLIMDQDKAGVKATFNIAEKLLSVGIIDVRIIKFKGYKDIDEYVLNNDNIDDILNNYDDYFSYKIRLLKSGFSSNNIDQKYEYIKETTKYFDLINSEKRNLLYIEIAENTNLSLENLKSVLNIENNIEKKIYPINKDKDKVKKKAKIQYADEEVLISYSFSKDGYIKIVELIEKYNYEFKSKNLKKIFFNIEQYFSNNIVSKKINITTLADIMGEKQLEYLLEIEKINIMEENIEKIFSNKKNEIKIYRR